MRELDTLLQACTDLNEMNPEAERSLKRPKCLSDYCYYDYYTSIKLIVIHQLASCHRLLILQVFIVTYKFI